MRISDHFLSLLHGPDDPLARQVIPDAAELSDSQAPDDPLAEEEQSPVPLVVHRYPGRVILLVSRQCAVHCRFCMRKRKVAHTRQVDAGALDQALAYIRDTPTVNEVILSGGDPLMLPDHHLLNIGARLRQIGHVRILRLHTRIPGVWPQRVTPALADALARLNPLYVNIHFNHPHEITPEAARACACLADAGLPLGSQTVLLNGINDDAEVLQKLMQRLITIRVRPYYLHQLDRVTGSAHFAVPLERGLRLMARLRGRLSGIAMPHFMIDLPQGGGKVELLPESVLGRSGDHWQVRNFQGRTFRYPLC